MPEEEERLSEEQQEIQQYFWMASEHLIESGEYSPGDVIQGFYRAALVAFMAYRRETTGDFAVEEIVKYLQSCRKQKHDAN